MKDVTMEQKLQLVKQIRSRYNEDQYDMCNREQILYGRSSLRDNRALHSAEEEGEAPPARGSSFKLRLSAALLFFLMVVLMETNGLKVAGITTEKIYQMISADYEQKIDEWVETFAASYSSPSK